jgi:hypothetical protein
VLSVAPPLIGMVMGFVVSLVAVMLGKKDGP